jgi:hypothetical protein
VVNGCLLPFLTASLLLCLNHTAVMGGAPQSRRANMLMAPCVALAIFLPTVVISGRLVAGPLGWRVHQQSVAAALVAALGPAVLTLLVRRAREPTAGAASGAGAALPPTLEWTPSVGVELGDDSFRVVEDLQAV